MNKQMQEKVICHLKRELFHRTFGYSRVGKQLIERQLLLLNKYHILMVLYVYFQNSVMD